MEAVFARGTIQTMHDKQIEIKRAVPRDSMPPSPRVLHHRSPMHHGVPPSMYEPHGPPEPWHRRGAPSHYGGGRGSGYGYGGGGGYRGGYAAGGGMGGPPHHGGGYGGRGSGAGMRSPPHHGHHGGHGGHGIPPQPFTPPAVVTGGASDAGCTPTLFDCCADGSTHLMCSYRDTRLAFCPELLQQSFYPRPCIAGIPASMAATPEGAAAIASGQGITAALPVMSTPMSGTPCPGSLPSPGFLCANCCLHGSQPAPVLYHAVPA